MDRVSRRSVVTMQAYNLSVVALDAMHETILVRCGVTIIRLSWVFFLIRKCTDLNYFYEVFQIWNINCVCISSYQMS